MLSVQVAYNRDGDRRGAEPHACRQQDAANGLGCAASATGFVYHPTHLSRSNAYSKGYIGPLRRPYIRANASRKTHTARRG